MASTEAANCLESHLNRLLSSREPPKTICPSEAPRSLTSAELQQLGASGWRDLMHESRRIVWEMRDKGEVEILQRGEVLGEDVTMDDVKGPIRVRRIAAQEGDPA